MTDILNGSIKAVLEMDYTPLLNRPEFTDIVSGLRALPPIDSQDRFDAYCQRACQLWASHFPPNGGFSPDVLKFCQRVARGETQAEVLPTSWGQVVVTRHDHPYVEKYLVVNQGGYLALEEHDEKLEYLRVVEGRGLILWSRICDGQLLVEELRPDAKFYFSPGMKHCIIGAESLLIHECSIDPKGMDQDLIFLYTPG